MNTRNARLFGALALGLLMLTVPGWGGGRLTDPTTDTDSGAPDVGNLPGNPMPQPDGNPPPDGTPIHYVSLAGSHVSPYNTPETAATNIAAAIGAAVDGDLVLVDAGIYPIATHIVITKAITVRSATGAASTIIDGQHLTRCVYMSFDNAVLDGFTVRNGYNPGNFGGGVNIVNNGTVQNCVLAGNQARDGGGVAIDNQGLVLNCLIYNNTAWDNGSSGYGGGVRLLNGGTARGCLIVSNVSFTYGGGLNIWNAGVVENCTLAYNSAPYGGGIRTRQYGTVVNSIIYFNSPCDWDLSGSGYRYSNCCTTASGSLPGAGNFTANPLFTDVAAGDFTLRFGSPCINAGLYQTWMTGASDLYGKDRILEGTVDVGACEFEPVVLFTITATAGANGTITPRGAVSVPSGDDQGFQIAPNPGYRIAGVVVDGVPVGVLSNVLFEDVLDNHTLNASFTPASWRKADFVITSAQLTPAAPSAGQPFTACVTVLNQGDIPGDAGRLHAWANHPALAGAGETPGASAVIGPLNPGQSCQVTLVGLTAPSANGDYTFRAFADGADVTAEKSEGNNQKTASYRIGPVYTPKPDFTVSSIAFAPATLTPGCTFTATVTVKNQASVPGNAGALRVWIHNPAAAAPGAAGNAVQTVGTLAAGETRVLTFGGLTAPTALGTYHFRAFVDANGATAESSEGNNQKTKTYTFVWSYPEKPDFKVTAVSIVPAPPSRGGAFTATVTIQNTGNVSGNAGLVRAWASHVAAAAPGEAGDAAQAGGALAVGESRVLTFTGLTAPSAKGTYHCRAFVDANGAAVEQSEGNNQKTTTYTLR